MKSGRFGTTGRVVLGERGGWCTRGTGVVKPLDRRPALTRWIRAGQRCVPVQVRRRPGAVMGGELPERTACRVRQVVVNVYGVATTRP